VSHTTQTHQTYLVTPGFAPTLHALDLFNELMRELFPTFGIPTTPTVIPPALPLPQLPSIPNKSDTPTLFFVSIVPLSVFTTETDPNLSFCFCVLALNGTTAQLALCEFQENAQILPSSSFLTTSQSIT
jgi:hypothetical protein